MAMSTILSRASRWSVFRRSLPLLLSSQKQQQQKQVPIICNNFHSLVRDDPNKFVAGGFNYSALNLFPNQGFGFASTASPEHTDKEQGGSVHSNGTTANSEQGKENDAKLSEQTEDSMSEEPKRSDSESEDEDELTMDDLVKLVTERDEQLELKSREIEQMRDKVLRSYAEMENVMQRTKREAENAKKFAVQNFAKSLLDVADNLARASSVVKESFSKVDTSNDAAGVVPLLKTLLEGVDMTEKQLLEVFKKYGVEKFDPTNEPFDPHRHNAVFQMPDATKTPGTVAAVLKAGYMLHDRIIRPAEVGVVQAVEGEEQGSDESSKGSGA